MQQCSVLHYWLTHLSILKVFYDTEKNKTSVLSELNVDSSEIRAVRSLNGEMYIMSQNKVYICFDWSYIHISDIVAARCVVHVLQIRNCLGAAISNFENSEVSKLNEIGS